MKSHYTVSLPVKAYIKKYVTAIEGNPIRFDSNSMLCMIIRAYLENTPKCGLSENQINTNLATRCHEIDIIIPLKRMGTIGYSIRPDNIVLINRFLEDCFERALLRFIKDYTKQEGRYKGYKEAYYTFAEMLSIDLDKDISLDGLRKIEYRKRQKNSEKNFLTLVPSLVSLD